MFHNLRFTEPTIGLPNYKSEERDVYIPNKNTYLLPPFDEFLISYIDGPASVPALYNSKVFSKNGIFYPVIVKEGTVTGTWRRNFGRETVNIEIEPFNSISDSQLKNIMRSAKKYGKFIQKSLPEKITKLF